MRISASGLIMTGGLLLTSVGLASCSSGVSRFDYPMFAASDNSGGDDVLTTASVTPVPQEPVHQAPAYQGGAASHTVTKSELPAPVPVYQPAPVPVQTAVVPQRVEPMPLPPKAPPVPASRTVTVKRGDTLSAISRRHGASVADIMAANNLKNTRLSLNQKLIIPGKGAVKATKRTASTYRVKRGDTLSLIASKHGIAFQDLAKYNGIRETTVLQLNQELKIPGGASGPVQVASRGSAIPLPKVNPARPANKAAPVAKPKKTASARKKKTLPAPQPMTGNQFRWPVRGRVISGYGAKPNGKHNDGINVAVPLGTSIKAAENGVVAYAGSELEGYGNLVLIRHANNWVSAYAHNDSILVKRGDEVRRGQTIGKAGKTGSVSQPQVHFELRKGSQPVNPLKYMTSG